MIWTLLYWFDGLGLALILGYKLWPQISKWLKKFQPPTTATPMSTTVAPAMPTGASTPFIAQLVVPPVVIQPQVPPTPTTTEPAHQAEAGGAQRPPSIANWISAPVMISFSITLAAIIMLILVTLGQAIGQSITLRGIITLGLWLVALGLGAYFVKVAVVTKKWKPAITAVVILIIAIGANWLVNRFLSKGSTVEQAAGVSTTPAVVTTSPTPVAAANPSTTPFTNATFEVVADEKCARLEFPMGLNVNWKPLAPNTYKVRTSDGKEVVFPAVTEKDIVVPSPLYPWFEFCPVDTDSIPLEVTIKRPS